MIRCQNRGGWYQWEAVQTEVDITIIVTVLFEDVTESFRLIFMCQDVLQQPKLSYTDYSNYEKMDRSDHYFIGSDRKPKIVYGKFEREGRISTTKRRKRKNMAKQCNYGPWLESLAEMMPCI